jgi:hypothetical protein
MKAKATAFILRARQCAFGVLAAMGSFIGASQCAAAPSFVYETPVEFLASGDFNGDGILDVLVLDKLTGNARVGYADNSGNLTWSSPLVTGVSEAEGCAVGRWLATNRDAIAVTAPALNRVNLVDLSGTNTAGTPAVITPNGLGPHTVLPLADPSGGLAPLYNDLLVASSENAMSAEFLDLMGVTSGVGTEAGQFHETGPFDRGNAIQLMTTTATYAAGVVRGTNDALDLWQFTNSPSAILSYSNLPSGSDYAVGLFNAETLPRFLFYQPGASNVTVVSLAPTGLGLAFSNTVSVSFTQAIQGVFYLNLGSSGGSFMVLFDGGVQGLQFPGGAPKLSAEYSSGAESVGNVFSGIVPLGGSSFALLDVATAGTPSVHEQVVHFDGTNFAKLTSGNLPTVTARNTRANIWIFQTEPFVNRQPGLIASFNTPDWSDGVSGLPASLLVTTETDGGAASGLGTAGSDNLGSAPAGSAFGLPNQYNQAISVFSYSSPQNPDPVTVTISPPPGIYNGAITISFSVLGMADRVYYRVGSGDSWHQYTAAFRLTNDNTVQYYGTNAAYTARSQLQSAVYSIGVPNQTTPTLNLATGATTTNPPIFTLPTNTTLSAFGTIFYGRRSTASNGTIWSINYDGSDDNYITTGVRPRVSRDGRWMAFMRGGSPFQSHGNVWLRNMQTGEENLLFDIPGTLVSYDWMPDSSGIVLDYDCGIYLLGTNGLLNSLAPTDCYEEAPTVNPVDLRVAFQDVAPGSIAAGIYVAAPGVSNAQQIVTSAAVPGASWPQWSPDGKMLSFTDHNAYGSLDNGTNLWVVNADGSGLNRICDLDGTANHFQHGALWSPDGSSLVGAGTIDGTNGLWIIPLNADHSGCYGGPTLLPTTPGDAIDMAGSIVLAPPPSITVQLGILHGANSALVYWSTNIPAWTLQYTLSLSPPVVWKTVSAPIEPQGLNFIYQDLLSNNVPAKFFRLVLP